MRVGYENRERDYCSRLEDREVFGTHIGLRGREHEWLRSHAKALREFSGEWMILEGEQVVGHGKEPAALIAESKRQGIKIPYVFFIPEIDNTVATLGL